MFCLIVQSRCAVDEEWRWGREGTMCLLRHWGLLFSCILQVVHISLKHSVCGFLPCLSLRKRKERDCKKKKKIIWMVNGRGTCAALASCHCLHCKRCQSHHVRLLPRGACRGGSSEQAVLSGHHLHISDCWQVHCSGLKQNNYWR